MEQQKFMDVLEKVDKLADLHQVSQAINSTRDLTKLLEISLNAAMQTLESDAGSIFLLEPGGQELVLRIARGKNYYPSAGMVKKIGEGIAGMVAYSKTPVLVKDIRNDPHFHSNGYHHYDTNSFICAPLVTTNKLIGVVNITEKRTGEHFDTDDLEFLSILASHVAIAVEKLQLYEEIRQFNLTLEEKVKLATEELKKNISEKIDLEKQLVISKRLAAISKIAASIAHELNNPLDGVIRYINLSLDHINKDEVLHEYLSEAKGGLSRMAEISRSLLDFFRQTVSVNIYVDIYEEIDKALIDAHRAQPFKKLEIIKKYQKEMPQLIDRGIQIAFSNIIKNALEAMPKGGKIKITTFFYKDDLYIRFKDTGYGIPDAIQEGIFQPFFTTKKMERGSGLGLAISNEIVQRYNGKITVSSHNGEGTIFTIQIPKGQNVKE
ncbi:MAG: ATP-binding protein [Candidatus Omnitrophota bacterium]